MNGERKITDGLATQAAFARLMGVSPALVAKWKNAGWLAFSGRLVEVDESRALLDRYRTPAEEPVNGAPAVNDAVNDSAAEVDDDGDEDGDDAAAVDALGARIIESTGAPWTRDEARRIKENYAAMRGRLAYDLDAGAVVAVAEVAALVGADYSQVRRKLLAIAPERAPEIHRCRSVDEVRDKLEAVITEALEALSRYPDAA